MKPDKPTLLSYITGGRYDQSSDLPPVRDKVIPALEFLTGAYEQQPGYTPSGFEAAMSVPVLGSVRKSKDLVKLYRGIDKWRRGQQVKKGMHVGGINKDTYAEMAKSNPDLARRMLEKFSKNIYTTPNKKFAEVFAKSGGRKGRVLEYQVPKKYIKKHGIEGGTGTSAEVLFEQGLPKEFFKKLR
jgi:hypothetical protein